MPMTSGEVFRKQARERAAKKFGFQQRGPTQRKSPVAEPLPAAPKTPSSASEMGGAVDTGGPAKKYGVNEPLSYLGHFANDDVAAKGHNTGAKSIGAPGQSTGVARAGFRKLSGTAANRAGKALKYGDVNAADSKDTRDATTIDELPKPKYVVMAEERREEEEFKRMMTSMPTLKLPWMAVPSRRRKRK